MPRNRAQRPGFPPTDDPTTIWSTWIQSVEWIDPDRERRFRDEVRDILWPVLGLRRGGTAVDVGCGGGALTRSLARWMGPHCTACGIDRDANFLDYARRRAREERLSRRTRYLQGDALALPLPDNSANVVTSYTVMGHIPDSRAFLREKIRVCRPGGRVSVMEVRSEGGIGPSSTRSAQPTQRERDLWKPLEKAFLRGVHRPWKVGATPVELAELPALFEDLGLRDIMLDAFAVTHSLDDARISEDEAKRHLQAQENWLLAAADHSASLLDRPLPRGHLASLKRCIRARFRKQRRWLDSGLHTWDFSIGLSWIVSGRLPGG